MICAEVNKNFQKDDLPYKQFSFRKVYNTLISYQGFAFGDLQATGNFEDEGEHEQPDEGINIEGPSPAVDTVNCMNYQKLTNNANIEQTGQFVLSEHSKQRIV